MADREAAGGTGNGKAFEICDAEGSLMLVEFQKDHLGVLCKLNFSKGERRKGREEGWTDGGGGKEVAFAEHLVGPS